MTCRKPCNDCPWRKESVPGWLGESSHDPVDFLESVSMGEGAHPCHQEIDWEAPDREGEISRASICSGYLHALANTCKIPRDPALATKVAKAGRNDEILPNFHAFIEHHEKK